MARQQLPTQTSSQNLMVEAYGPSPTFHLTPIWAVLHAQRTPFQKGEALSLGQQKMLGPLMLDLESTIFL